MVIDCEKCEVRDIACGECVVSVMLAGPMGRVELGEPERRALDILADGGMIPPLRLSIPGERAS